MTKHHVITTWAYSIALVVVIGVLLFTLYQIREVRLDIIRIHKEIQEQRGESLERYTTTWTSGGMTHTVITDREDEEAVDAWAVRHQTAVDALKSLYPPD